VLIREGLPLADAAMQCGFCDQSQLTRILCGRSARPPAASVRASLP